MTNKCQIGSIRGVGWAAGQIAREVMIDDVARALEMDPVDLRLKNMIGPEPRRSATGASYDGGSYRESLERVTDQLGYKEFRERQRRERKNGRFLGIGFSPFIEPTGMGAKMSRAGGFPGGYYDSASVTMEPDGSVTVMTGFHSHGQGHETTFAQVAADQLGVPMERVRVSYGDTDSAPYSMGTFASRSAIIGTGAITNAAGELRERLFDTAAIMLEASAADLEAADGKIRVKGSPSRSVPIGEVSMYGYFSVEARPEAVQKSGLTVTSAYEPEETYANGCAGVIVDVDPETGMVTLERVVAVEDCGVVLNPMIVKGQIAGGIVMGIGIALFEGLEYDRDGQFVSGSLLDYLYPTTGEIPLLELSNIETPSACTGGVKGVGEAGMHVCSSGRSERRRRRTQPVRLRCRPDTGDSDLRPRSAEVTPPAAPSFHAPGPAGSRRRDDEGALGLPEDRPILDRAKKGETFGSQRGGRDSDRSGARLRQPTTPAALGTDPEQHPDRAVPTSREAPRLCLDRGTTHRRMQRLAREHDYAPQRSRSRGIAASPAMASGRKVSSMTRTG